MTRLTRQPQYESLRQIEHNLAEHITSLIQNEWSSATAGKWLANMIVQGTTPGNIIGCEGHEPDILLTIGELIRDVTQATAKIAQDIQRDNDEAERIFQSGEPFNAVADRIVDQAIKDAGF